MAALLLNGYGRKTLRIQQSYPTVLKSESELKKGKK